jgi:hypothetical protein
MLEGMFFRFGFYRLESMANFIYIAMEIPARLTVMPSVIVLRVAVQRSTPSGFYRV